MLTNAFSLKVELSTVQKDIDKTRAAILCSSDNHQTESIYRLRKDKLKSFIKAKYRIVKLLKYWI